MKIFPIIKNTFNVIQQNISNLGQIIQNKIYFVALTIFNSFATAFTFCCPSHLRKIKHPKKQTDNTTVKKNPTETKIDKINKKHFENKKDKIELEKEESFHSQLKNNKPENHKTFEEKINRDSNLTNHENLAKPLNQQDKVEEVIPEPNLSGITNESSSVTSSPTPSQNSPSQSDNELACESDETITEVISNNHKINVTEAMTNLTQLCQLLQLIHVGTKSFLYSAKTVEILLNYQSLINNALSTTNRFQKCSIKALEHHQKSLNFLEKKKMKLVMEEVVHNGGLATEMGVLSKKLADESTNLYNHTIKVLEAIIDDENVSFERKRRVKKMISDPQTSETSQSEKIKNFKKTVGNLKKYNSENARLNASIDILELTIHKMAKIKRSFENTQFFWEGVKESCDKVQIKLSDIIDKDDIAISEEMSKAIKESGSDWLVLGKINISATCAMKQVSENIEAIVDNLPTNSEAIQSFYPLCESMLLQLERDV